MTDEKKPFSFAAPFTAPSVEPDPEPATTATIEDIDTLKPGQTITITNILDDNVYTELLRKHSIAVDAGTLKIAYSRVDDRVDHNEWAKGGTLTVTRK